MLLYVYIYLCNLWLGKLCMRMNGLNVVSYILKDYWILLLTSYKYFTIRCTSLFRSMLINIEIKKLLCVFDLVAFDWTASVFSHEWQLRFNGTVITRHGVNSNSTSVLSIPFFTYYFLPRVGIPSTCLKYQLK